MNTTKSYKPCGVGPRLCQVKHNRAWAVTTTATGRHPQAGAPESPWPCRPDHSRSLPFYGPARGFSFAREIQPILDRLCPLPQRCPDKPLNLTTATVTVGTTKRTVLAILPDAHSRP